MNTTHSALRPRLPDLVGRLLWTFTGAGAALATVSSVGVFLIPAVIAAAVWLWRRTDRWQRAGFVFGVGLVILGIGIANLGANPCAVAGTGTGSEVGGCGGTDPRPWLGTGVLILTGSLVLSRLPFLRRGRTSHTTRATQGS